ncbi:MAG: ATPase V [Bacteroidales bacterium]|nr:ATPase V [Bacteroidales bacterium]
MIASMTKYSFILLNGEQDALLEKLQEVGLMDITRSVKPVDKQSSGLLADVERRRDLVQAIARVQFPEDLQPATIRGELLTTAEHAVKTLENLEAERKAVEKDAAARLPWGDFSGDKLRKLADAGCPVTFHIVPAKSFQPDWADTCAMQVVSESDGKVYFAVAGADTLPGRVHTPEGTYADAVAHLADLDARIDAEKAVLLTVRDREDELEAESRKRLSDLDLYLAAQAAVPAAENTLVTLVGYAPTESEAAVTAACDEAGVFYLKDAAQVEDNPPISFRNNKFVRMFEVLTDMYGRPAYNGFDPTPFIAVFFLLFFAFCMGDAGYGLVLVGIGLLLKKVDSFKGFSPLVVCLGIATAVIGFLFHTFFSVDISQWRIFQGFPFLPAKIAGYDGTMVLALVVGVLHISLAMIVKTIGETRTKGFKESLGTWGWTLLIVGGVAVAGFALTGVLDKAATKWIIIVLGVLSCLGIFVLNDIHRNPLVNIGSGLWDTYNMASGLLGDVLSYLRLYALGLAGSMLGMAFNSIGSMILGDGSKWLLWIPFLLIVIVGHTLNIAMCVLGAFVHPLRLNFLEFFKNSGYEAAGRNYHPLKKQ